MKVDEKALGCAKCTFKNGNVCNICYKKVYDDFLKRKERVNGKEKRISRENENN